MAMTPEEYISKLDDVWSNLDILKFDVGQAIRKMGSRLETGYEHHEDLSRTSALAAYELTKKINKVLQELVKAQIEY